MTNKIKSVAGRAVPLLIDNMDTDRIIPARFLKTITFEGLGEHAFYDEKKDANFALNDEKYNGATVIISGKNFGCGSSREHAPQSIKRAGFKAVIAESFGEIFFGNSLTIGLVCGVLSKKDIDTLAAAVKENPKEIVELCLVGRTVRFMDGCYELSIPDDAAKALINGSYDLIYELLDNVPYAKELSLKLQY
jgi:3-isopropylmalate/(R)-2-methylmalate dehydratase small subunit